MIHKQLQEISDKLCNIEQYINLIFLCYILYV